MMGWETSRVLRCVTVGRVVAAADLAVLHAHPQMHRERADLQALRTADERVGYRCDLDRVGIGADGGAHVGPNLSVLTRLGSWPSATSAAATASTNPVGPQAET